MKDITTEEAIQTLKDFAMYGRYYSNNTEHHMKSSINRVLNELEKKDKQINAMAEFIDTELSSEHLTRVLKKEVLPLKTYREDIKQYFEKEVKDEYSR